MQFITYHHIIKCCVLLTHLFIPTMLLSLWLLDLLTFSGKKKQQQKPYQQSQYNTIYILPFLFIHYTIHSNPTLLTIFKQRRVTIYCSNTSTCCHVSVRSHDDIRAISMAINQTLSMMKNVVGGSRTS